MRPLPLSRALHCLVATLACLPLKAQEPTPRALADRAHQLVTTLRDLADVDQPSAEQKQALTDAEQQLAAFVKQAQGATDWTVEHFVEASSPLLESQPAAGLAISEAGLKLFPTARFLWDHAGLAHLALAVNRRASAARVTSLNASEKAFTQALKHEPATCHAHIGLFQVLDLLGDTDGAMRQLRAALAFDEGKQALPLTWLHTTSLLLRQGKGKEALPVLDAVDAATADFDPLWPAILRVRALAIAKDVAATEAAIAALLAQTDSPRTQLEAADALFFVGKKAEAQKALAKLPALGKWENEEERIGQLCTQSGKALAAYWQATDVSAKGPLRAALKQALGHTFLVMDGTAKPKPKNTDLSDSPLAMAHLLTMAKPSEQKDWANRVLLVLCLQASADYKPTPFETGILATVAKDRATVDDIPGVRMEARYAVGDPDTHCALSGQHAIERVTQPPKRAVGK